MGGEYVRRVCGNFWKAMPTTKARCASGTRDMHGKWGGVVTKTKTGLGGVGGGGGLQFLKPPPPVATALLKSDPAEMSLLLTPKSHFS